MLKIIYLEDEIYLEYLQKSVETWKSDRILVNLRAALSTYVESSIASLIVPINHDRLKGLVNLAEQELIDLAVCDEEYMEICLSGTWIAENEHSEVGIFACELSYESECFLYKLWQESQAETSVITE